MDVSMYVAGRKICASMSTSGRPGRRASIALSTSLVTCSVLPHGNFSTMHKTWPVIDNPVADHGLMIDHDLGDILQDQLPAVPDRKRHVGQTIGFDLGRIVDERKDVPDLQTLIRRIDPAARPDVVCVVPLEQPGLESPRCRLIDLLERDIMFRHPLGCTAASRVSWVRAAAVRRSVLTFENASSMGFRSGE